MKKALMAIMMVTTMTLVPATAQAKTEELIDYGQMRLSAYCPCESCSEGFGRQCSMKGHYCRSEHTIAVDPDIIPLGSKVKIGDEYYVAEDTGGLIFGDRIDIFFDTHEEVEEFEIKYKHCWVVKD